MNKVVLIGRLVADPELRQTQSGISACRFRIAVNRRYKNDRGEYEADFINCTAWRQTAEFISRYFSKGSMIAVEGSLRTGSYQDRTHADVTHYTTDVYVDNAEFCGSKAENNGGGSYTAAPASAAQKAVQAAQSAGVATQQMSYSNDSEFEEILSDGDVPF
jgi:single-strand DNA-binding protein